MSRPLGCDRRSTTVRTLCWLAYSVFLSTAASSQQKPDAQILALINQIKAVDNHSHALPVPGQTALDLFRTGVLPRGAQLRRTEGWTALGDLYRAHSTFQGRVIRSRPSAATDVLLQ